MITDIAFSPDDEHYAYGGSDLKVGKTKGSIVLDEETRGQRGIQRGRKQTLR
jgi:hypothetical protein